MSEDEEATAVVQADSGGRPHCGGTDGEDGKDRWREAAKGVTVG